MNNIHSHFHIQDTPFLHKRVTLIKRPPLVRSCSPTLTEKKNKKSVRFHDNASLENVRLFLKSQTPKACRADPTCYQKKHIINLRKPNWTGINTKSHAVRLEDIQLNKIDDIKVVLQGTIQVSNLAFEKHVEVIYTLDDWNTVQKLDARYLEPIAHSANTWDRFSFEIRLKQCHQTVYLAVKYTVAGREFWDNNQDKNYELDIIPDVQLYELQPEDDDITTSSDEEESDEEIKTFKQLSLMDDPVKTATPPHSPPCLSNEELVSPPTPLSPTTPADDANPMYYFQSNNNALIHSYFYTTAYPEPKSTTTPPSSPKLIH